MMIILRILRIQPWLGPTKLHCFGLSISFNLIYNIYVVCREFLSRLKFCVYPQLPAKIFDLTEDYKTSCQFYIFLYFVIFFSLLLQADCVASNQLLIFTCFHRKYLSFPCFTDIPKFCLNPTIFLLVYQKNLSSQTHFTIVVIVFTWFVGQLPTVWYIKHISEIRRWKVIWIWRLYARKKKRKTL